MSRLLSTLYIGAKSLTGTKNSVSQILYLAIFLQSPAISAPCCLRLPEAHHTLDIDMNAWDLNPCPYACTSSTFPS